MKLLKILSGLVLLASAPAALADVSNSEIEALREQIRMLSQRLDQLEQANAETSSEETLVIVETQAAPANDTELDAKIDQAVAEKVDAKMAAVSWAERIRWSGDFRYRYETVTQDNNPDRDRNRIRARAHLQADISDTMKVGIGLASGSDDPVSTNQTLGGGGSSKPLSLDLAYFQWTGLNNTKVVGGKFKNDLYRPGDNGLLWDSDWRPEGTSVYYDNGTLFAVGLGTWVESDSNKSTQEFAYGLQGGVNLDLGESVLLTLGIGYFHIDSAGKSSFYGDGDFFGNSFDPVTETYLYNYYEIEGFAQLGFSLLDRPVMVFVDYVNNTEVDENNVGYAFGFQYGIAKKKGTWEFAYTYEKLEADAVFGLLTDSDFGNGGTNAKGSVFKGAYAFHDNWNFSTSYFLNKIDIDTPNPSDSNRWQLDLNFKFK
ncbi:MAG TPA: putative porin [Xanthomonadales bacterium]|nr:putative porin [Xanthomonadales bacterium]